MVGRMHRAALVVMVGSALGGVGTARGAGSPVFGFGAGSYAGRAPGSATTYQARPVRADTILRAVAGNRRILMTTRLRGRFTIPVVALQGPVGGISENGRTLVLAAPRRTFPQRSSAFAIVDAATLHPRRYLRLRGDFSFDAISPNGRWIYLIEYVSATDATRYRVRAMDARSGLLLGREIVDPHDRREAMGGYPVTRVTSAGGRWAYTLYGGGERTFVHALDTERLTARCIDLPAFPASSPWTSGRLTLDPARELLLVRAGRRTVAAISTASLTVLRRSAGRSRASGGPIGIAFPLAAACVLLGTGLLAIRRRLGQVPKAADAQ